jgi:hypothetical protein
MPVSTALPNADVSPLPMPLEKIVALWVPLSSDGIIRYHPRFLLFPKKSLLTKTCGLVYRYSIKAKACPPIHTNPEKAFPGYALVQQYSKAMQKDSHLYSSTPNVSTGTAGEKHAQG